MKVVAFTGQKGGVGKTTLAVHLAAFFSEEGHKVSLIDRDPQGAAASWSENLGFSIHSDLNRPLASIIESRRNSGDDWCIIDTAPTIGGAFREIPRLADLVILPARPSILDVRAVLASLQELRRQSSSVKAFCILTQVAERTKITKEAIEGLDELKIPVFATRIKSRTGYARAVIDSNVFDHEEIEQLSREIKNTLTV